ncbi:hypothetical protein [Natronoglycomyces albus]|uniref:Uncharacterized protein n=1 Tax=Natronoglycomyces albus TaxID=2811108 RepID=A0A895XUK4_9ACTN|nr:hypothetical protein [Natronoglycomyces albus]QSB05910.1 hypothetical protein JQS30_03010 [Natronoglycomyces albus]
MSTTDRATDASHDSIPASRQGEDLAAGNSTATAISDRDTDTFADSGPTASFSEAGFPTLGTMSSSQMHVPHSSVTSEPTSAEEPARGESPLDKIIARAKVANPVLRRQRKADRARHDADFPLPGTGPSAPRVDTPQLRLRRLAGVAVWALTLVLAGVGTAIVALVQIFSGAPAWFQPVFTGTGVVGMLLAMSAFASVRFRGIPWLLLAASTMTLAVALALIALM